MSDFVKIDPADIEGNAYRLFHEGWGLVTAGKRENFNTMTVSWGMLGCLWNKVVCNLFVRPTRYTYGYMEKSPVFTLSLFEKEDCRKELGRLGSQSGRDIDKMHDSGLTPAEFEGYTAFGEAKYVLVLKQLYSAHQFDVPSIPADARERNYSGAMVSDPHRVFTCEIIAAYKKQ